MPNLPAFEDLGNLSVSNKELSEAIKQETDKQLGELNALGGLDKTAMLREAKTLLSSYLNLPQTERQADYSDVVTELKQMVSQLEDDVSTQVKVTSPTVPLEQPPAFATPPTLPSSMYIGDSGIRGEALVNQGKILDETNNFAEDSLDKAKSLNRADLENILEEYKRVNAPIPNDLTYDNSSRPLTQAFPESGMNQSSYLSQPLRTELINRDLDSTPSRKNFKRFNIQKGFRT